MTVRQPVLPSLVAERQPIVIDPQRVQNCRLVIVNIHGILKK